MSGWMRLWIVLSAIWVAVAAAESYEWRGFYLDQFVFMTLPLGLLWGIAWIVAGFRQKGKAQA